MNIFGNAKRLLAIALLFSACFASAQKKTFTPEQKLRYAETIIENFYVDEVNADSLVEEAIKGMLNTLDPHSAYTNAQETEDLNAPLEGKFSGIGIQFNMSTDTVYVIQTISGGPCEKVGIRPGDRIIWADDTLLAGRKLPNSSVMRNLRGPKGSQVLLKVKRAGEPDLIEFLVTRDDIPINSVDAYYMVTPEIGYISLTRFAEDSGKEVSDAIRKLKAQGMKELILDLEGNGGGYLNAAVEIASLFLPVGSLVVYTMDREGKKNEYRSKSLHPLFSGPVVVMVDQYSASASEILAGALQDNDRGTVVGRRTFGKGLVQRPFPFPDGSMIRLTVSRYYTPAGRCIQKHYEKGKGEEYALDMLSRYESGELWSADSIHFDESQVFTTKKGRIVYGGGGIMPDEFVPVDTTYNSPYYRGLVAKNVLAPFTISYIDRNREQLLAKYADEKTFAENFEVTKDMLDEVVKRATEAGVEFNKDDYERSLPIIKAVIKGLLTRDLYEDGIYVRSTNPLNPIFNKAVEVLEYPDGKPAEPEGDLI